MDIGLGGLIERMEEHLGPIPMKALYLFFYFVVVLVLVQLLLAATSAIGDATRSPLFVRRAGGWIAYAVLLASLCGVVATLVNRWGHRFFGTSLPRKWAVQEERIKKAMAQLRSDAADLKQLDDAIQSRFDELQDLHHIVKAKAEELLSQADDDPSPGEHPRS